MLLKERQHDCKNVGVRAMTIGAPIDPYWTMHRAAMSTTWDKGNIRIDDAFAHSSVVGLQCVARTYSLVTCANDHVDRRGGCFKVVQRVELGHDGRVIVGVC